VELNKKILIVEDDAFLRDVYADTLKGEGFTIEIAVDGEDALNKIKAGGWDLVLLDIRLPKMSGFEVIDALKKDPDYKMTIPFVFLTNLDNDSDIKRALEVGSGYLIKSQITPGDLIHEIKMYLSKPAGSGSQTSATSGK
jgi:CheY-like chemotaxis protein